MRFRFEPTAPFDETGPTHPEQAITIKIPKDDEDKARHVLRSTVRRQNRDKPYFHDFRTWKLISKTP